MPAFCDYGCQGVLTINSVALNCPAWDVPNLAKLWFEEETKGTNLELPLAEGKRAYPYRTTEIEHELLLCVTGDCDLVGTPYANPWVGLQTNLSFLRTFVFAPVITAPGTRIASLGMPDATLLEADVQPKPLRQVADIDNPSYCEFLFSLVVPLGRFV